MSKKGKYILLVLVLVLASTVLQCITLGTIANAKRQNKVQQAYLYGQTVVDAIQLKLDNALEVTRTLKYPYLDYGEAFFENFEKTAGDIAVEHPLIESMYIAPKGVIKYAYPGEVKDATIGYNMLDDPEQGPRAKLAVDTGKITVAGPHELVEGGHGFIVRNPVFMGDEFVGFTIIVLDWDKFMDSVQSTSIVQSTEFDFALMKKNLDEQAKIDEFGYIYNSSGRNIDTQIGIEFEVPNDIWQLYVEPVEGWSVYREMRWQITSSVLFSLTFIVFIIIIIVTLDRRRMMQREIIANEARNSFLARMSHDIRTPLNGILGLIEINEMHPDDDELNRENRRKARIAANHLLSLISDVLELQKMEEKNVVLAEEPFDFAELANDVLTISSVKAAENGINLIYKSCVSALLHPYVYGSPLHVRQIMINIIGNAIKYNKPGGSVEYSVEEIYADAGNVKLKIEISDTGIGMSPEFMERMFDPFSQEHSDARSTYQGTGLGMAIVKSLVDKMGGSIDVDSKIGEGTRFVVILPFRIAIKEDIPSFEPKDSISIEGMKILLVEDNELNMEIAESILSDYGATITTAVNGEEAVEKFTSNEPGTFDLILMDIMMPILDGYGATEQIRAYDRPDAKEIPIIAMTANAFAEDIQKCIDAGMDAHIAKPIDVNKLLVTIAEVMD